MIKAARKHAGLSQAELARRAGTSQPALARYETGAMLPSLPTVERLLGACGQQLRLAVVDAPQPSVDATSVRARLGFRARQLRRNRKQLLDSARANGVRSVHVFGSVARGDDGPASDIDLLVALAPGRTLLDVIGFRNQASEILGVPVDVATLDMLKERVRADVLAEALPL